MSTDRAATPPVDLHRVAILVLGMHRSGTSALTWLLGRMGAALPRDAIPSSGENSKGYWESAGLVAADDRLLRAAGSSWFDPRPLALANIPPALLAERIEGIRLAVAEGWGTAPLLAVKDPRQCRFVPTMAALLTDAGIEPRAVLMLRSAADVAGSLHSRDATTRAYAELLWLRHMLDAERDSRPLRRAVVSYDGLLADWRATAATIAPLLGREGWTADDEGEVDAFLDPALRHHAGQRTGAPGPLGDLIEAAERAFALLLAEDGAVARAALDDVARRLAAMPWLEGDLIHDELRHRRAPAAPPDLPVEPPAPDPAPEPAAPRADEDALPADHDGDVRLIRDSGLFDEDWYRRTYPDVAASGMGAVEHYLAIGAREGRNPGPLFDTAYYARQMARRTAAEGSER
jgi:hypothetical protein